MSTGGMFAVATMYCVACGCVGTSAIAAASMSACHCGGFTWTFPAAVAPLRRCAYNRRDDPPGFDAVDPARD